MTSLVAVAAGFCAWRAIKAAGTWAGPRVLWEPVDTIDVTSEPMVIIYCDSGKVGADQGPLLGGAGLRMRIETWMGGGDQNGLAVGLSSALPFALFWRQIARALYDGPSGSWSDLFRTFAGRTLSSETLFDLYQGPKGERIAVRAQEMQFGECLAEPAFGRDAEGAWARWIAKMREETAEIAAIADTLAAHIKGASLEDWRADIAALGVPSSDAGTLRLTAPAYPRLGDAPGPLDVDALVASAAPPALTP